MQKFSIQPDSRRASLVLVIILAPAHTSALDQLSFSCSPPGSSFQLLALFSLLDHLSCSRLNFAVLALFSLYLLAYISSPRGSWLFFPLAWPIPSSPRGGLVAKVVQGPGGLAGYFLNRAWAGISLAARLAPAAGKAREGVWPQPQDPAHSFASGPARLAHILFFTSPSRWLCSVPVSPFSLLGSVPPRDPDPGVLKRSQELPSACQNP